MGNLHSITTNQAAIIALFRVVNRSWRDFLDVQATGEFDNAHFHIVGFRQTTGGAQDAFQPRSIGSDQQRVFTGR